MTRIERILIIGIGKLGAALVPLLSAKYGNEHVLVAENTASTTAMGPFQDCYKIDLLEKWRLRAFLSIHEITQVYLVEERSFTDSKATIAEKWQTHITQLLNVLDLAIECKLDKVFWPSSISVFGEGGQNQVCGQHCPMEPLNVTGISKAAGERWCRYYYASFGVDVRSLRLPVVIGGQSVGASIQQYPIELIKTAIMGQPFTCRLKEPYRVPAIYLPDLATAVYQLMEAPKNVITIRSSYNISAFSFTPEELLAEVQEFYPDHELIYGQDNRKALTTSWPTGIEDSQSVNDWGWKPAFDLRRTVSDVIKKIMASMAAREEAANVKKFRAKAASVNEEK